MSTYLTFPISILRTGFDDIKATCSNVMDYTLFALFRTLEGNDDVKLTDAAEKLEINFGNEYTALANGEKLYNETRNQPMASVPKDVVFSFYKERKKEHEIACFLAFCGVKSILGRKPHIKTNKAFIHARMFGYRSPKEMAEMTPIEAKYSTRRRMDRLIRDLEFNWGLKAYAHHCRGIYLGFSKVDYNDLAKVCEANKKKSKKENLQAKKQAARNKLKKPKMYALNGDVQLKYGNQKRTAT